MSASLAIIIFIIPLCLGVALFHFSKKNEKLKGAIFWIAVGVIIMGLASGLFGILLG